MHATFFVIGPYVQAEPRVARRVAQRGSRHRLARLDALAEHDAWATPACAGSSIPSEAPWWRAAKVTPVGWLRPPYGDHDGTTVAAAGSVGFAHVVMWDVDPGDWRGYGAGTIAANTLSHVHSGAIIGLHVRASTMAALPDDPARPARPRLHLGEPAGAVPRRRQALSPAAPAAASTVNAAVQRGNTLTI